MQKTVSFNGDAFSAFKRFAGQKGVFFLDSSLKSKDNARSFIGFSPSKVIIGQELDGLRAVLSWQQRLKAKAVGYIAYEGSFHFGLYQNWLEIDHAKDQMHVHAASAKMMRRMIAVLEQPAVAVPVMTPQQFTAQSNFDKKSYIKAVKTALQAITRGDIYQINLSRKITADIVLDPLLLYAALREFSPSPFAAFYDNGKEQILSSSPERFVRLTGRSIEVKPMKGTRPRGTTATQDARLRKELQSSAKEIAELLMVTDLERNDLGRVCETGSVKVKSLRTIEAYASVFQATATIVGKLRTKCSALDLIKAAFPSGSVTGCPKIAAMKFIKAIEREKRGFYTGALGHIDVNGDMDLSVLIRSVLVSPKGLCYHVGGGIVADSDPALEYAETALKAQAIERAIREVICA